MCRRVECARARGRPTPAAARTSSACWATCRPISGVAVAKRGRKAAPVFGRRPLRSTGSGGPVRQVDPTLSRSRAPTWHGRRSVRDRQAAEGGVRALNFAAAATATGEVRDGAPDAPRGRGSPPGRPVGGKRARQAKARGQGRLRRGRSWAPRSFALPPTPAFFRRTILSPPFRCCSSNSVSPRKKFFASDPTIRRTRRTGAVRLPPHGQRTCPAPRGPERGRRSGRPRRPSCSSGRALGCGGSSRRSRPSRRRAAPRMRCRSCGERAADAEKDFDIAGMLSEEGVTTAADPARARAAVAEVRAELAGQQAELDGGAEPRSVP